MVGSCGASTPAKIAISTIASTTSAPKIATLSRRRLSHIPCQSPASISITSACGTTSRSASPAARSAIYSTPPAVDMLSASSPPTATSPA